MSLGSETVYIHAPVPVDDFGDPIVTDPPTEPPDPVKVEGCAVYPRGASSEEEYRASTVIEGITALLPGELDIDPKAQIEWRGRTFDVVGESGIWAYLDGQAAGTQVNGKRAAG